MRDCEALGKDKRKARFAEVIQFTASVVSAAEPQKLIDCKVMAPLRALGKFLNPVAATSTEITEGIELIQASDMLKPFLVYECGMEAIEDSKTVRENLEEVRSDAVTYKQLVAQQDKAMMANKQSGRASQATWRVSHTALLRRFARRSPSRAS